MGKARVRLTGERKALSDLLRSDWEELIKQAALGEEDTTIATMYLLDAVPQIDIAIELGVERSTVSKRLPRILDKVERAARKMKLI